MLKNSRQKAVSRSFDFVTTVLSAGRVYIRAFGLCLASSAQCLRLSSGLLSAIPVIWGKVSVRIACFFIYTLYAGQRE